MVVVITANASIRIRALEIRLLAPRSRCRVDLATDMMLVKKISWKKSVLGRGEISAGCQAGRESVGGLLVFRFLSFCSKASLCWSCLRHFP